jgi:hypothetical protein
MRDEMMNNSMETIDGDTFTAAWDHWLEVTMGMGWDSVLFVQLTGCGMVDLNGMKVTAEQASRVRHMAGPNYHAYIKATLAKHEGTIDGN